MSDYIRLTFTKLPLHPGFKKPEPATKPPADNPQEPSGAHTHLEPISYADMPGPGNPKG